MYIFNGFRSIALHHLIRQYTNPSSSAIRAFDQRIERALKNEKMLQTIEKELAEEEERLATSSDLSGDEIARSRMKIDELKLQKSVIDGTASLTADEVKE